MEAQDSFCKIKIKIKIQTWVQLWCSTSHLDKSITGYDSDVPRVP